MFAPLNAMNDRRSVYQVPEEKTPSSTEISNVYGQQKSGSSQPKSHYSKQARPQVKRKLELDARQLIDDPPFKTPRASTKGRGSRKKNTKDVAPSVTKEKSAKVTKRRCSKSEMANEESPRYETSLGILTKKFVNILRASPYGVLDLNKATELLDVQKRRIYDITNVLEGIGLIQKEAKNNIRWKGAKHLERKPVSLDREQAEIATRMVDLHGEVQDLKMTEEELDHMIEQKKSQMGFNSTNEELKRYAYVTYQDLRGISEFHGTTVIAVKAPPETRLEVPKPEEALQIWLKSGNGPIDVFLCPDNKENIDPISDSERDHDSSSAESQLSPIKSDDDNDYMPRGDYDAELSRFSQACGVQTTPVRHRQRTLSSMNSPESSCLDDNIVQIEELLSYEDIEEIDGNVSHFDINFGSPDYSYSLEPTEGITDLFSVISNEGNTFNL